MTYNPILLSMIFISIINLINGAFPPSKASFHLKTHKHQPSPSFNPGKLYSGLGVIKSLPCFKLNCKF